MSNMSITGQNRFIIHPFVPPIVRTANSQNIWIVYALGLQFAHKKAPKKHKKRTVEEDLFDRQLIKLVRDYELIWNYHHNDHCNNEKTEESWCAIADTVGGGKDWNACKGCWKKIRDYFVTIKNKLPPSGSAYEEAQDKVKWPLYRLLEFLLPTMKSRKSWILLVSWQWTMNDQTGNLSFLAEFNMPLEFIEPIQFPKIVLGKGEYGEVVQSLLHIPLWSLTVTVKIIKANLPVDEISELLSEVKLMIHAGNHVNVLPLIGTVTSCLGKGKMYVVTEYCKYGSLLHVLQSHRNSFINEPTLNSRIRADNNNVPSPVGYLMPLLSQLTAIHRCHAQGSVDSNRLCTTDLIYFSCQIANGLEFLSSRNVMIIHCDLAARNILLTENYLIRISDFGLSHEGKVYQLKNYKLKLPLHWMAYESLTDHIFSTQSDVWSFGIVLWEIFTLDQHPFPEYRNGADLKKALQNGYQLPKPIYASDKIYNLMLQCWSLKPEYRPSFTECKISLKNELRRFCKDCYNKFDIILNDPKNQPDYSILRTKFVVSPVPSTKEYEISTSQRNNELL